MKILLLGCKDYPPFTYSSDVGGIETFVQETVTKIKGIRFYLYTRKYNKAPKYSKIGNFDIYRVPFINSQLLKTFSFNLTALPEAWKLIKKEKIDLIWAIEPVAGSFAYILSKITGVPYTFYVFSKGSLEPSGMIRRIGLKILEMVAYKSPKEIMFVSRSLQEYFSNIYKVDKSYYVPLTTSLEKFRNTKPINLIRSLKKNKKKILLFIGRLHVVKGLEYLFKAFSQIDRKDLVLIIVGDGPLRDELKELAQKLNIYDRVIFMGARRDIKNIIPFVDIFVLPSLSEGTPLTVLESLAAGVPVVVTRVGDIPDMVERRSLVNPRDVESLKLKILEKLISKKRSKIKNEYITKNVVKLLENVLK